MGKTGDGLGNALSFDQSASEGKLTIESIQLTFFRNCSSFPFFSYLCNPLKNKG